MPRKGMYENGFICVTILLDGSPKLNYIRERLVPAQFDFDVDWAAS